MKHLGGLGRGVEMGTQRGLLPSSTFYPKEMQAATVFPVTKKQRDLRWES